MKICSKISKYIVLVRELKNVDLQDHIFILFINMKVLIDKVEFGSKLGWSFSVFFIQYQSRVSEWLLINANSAIFQLYHGTVTWSFKNKKIFEKFWSSIKKNLVFLFFSLIFNFKWLIDDQNCSKCFLFSHLIFETSSDWSWLEQMRSALF